MSLQPSLEERTAKIRGLFELRLTSLQVEEHGNERAELIVGRKRDNALIRFILETKDCLRVD